METRTRDAESMRLETLFERPIPDRYRLIFYVGHVDAFDWNQLGRGVPGLPSFDPSLDRLFAAGIDPPPGQAPSDAPSDWPALEQVRAHVARMRFELDRFSNELPSERVLTALGHRWMHAETLCCLLHQLEPSQKRLPASLPHAAASADLPVRDLGPWVETPAGPAILGQDAGEFGCDNEFPRHAIDTAAFEIARHKLTNGEYLRFVDYGGPPPHFWRPRGGKWWLRRMFDEAPMPLDAPVHVTQREATAYADWAGARLPTEAGWQRARISVHLRHGATRPWPRVSGSRSAAQAQAQRRSHRCRRPGGRRVLHLNRTGGTEMLAQSQVTCMLPVKDLARARQFYEEGLQLEPLGQRPDGKFVYRCGGTEIALFPKPEGTRAEHTAISFAVPDIRAAIVELKGRGVAFEDYDLPDFKTVEHVCVLGSEKAAWFRDPEGNILCLHEDLD